MPEVFQQAIREHFVALTVSESVRGTSMLEPRPNLQSQAMSQRLLPSPVRNWPQLIGSPAAVEVHCTAAPVKLPGPGPSPRARGWKRKIVS